MKRVLLALTLAAFALPSQAEAQISNGDVNQVTYRGHSGWYTSGGRQLALPFYDFSITGVGAPGGGYWDFLCIDPTQYVNSGPYNALFTEVAAGSSFAGTRLGSSSSTLNNYLITAYLYEQAQFATAANDRDRLHAIQRAAWFATAGSTPGMYGWSEGMGVENDVYLAARNAVLDGWTAQGFYVVTARNADGSVGRGQEFLVRVDVPEPGTLALFGSGLLGLIGVGARRRRNLDTGSLA